MRRYRGSYTIEAAFVMAVVLWALMLVIQSVFNLRDEVVGAMALQEAVERYRYGENMSSEEAEDYAKAVAAHPFSFGEYQICLEKSGNLLTGSKVRGLVEGGGRRLDIESGVYDPENFLRMLTLAGQEE